MSPRVLAAIHALLAAAVLACALVPLEPIVDAASILPILAGIAGIVAVLGPALTRTDGGDPPDALDGAGAVLAALPVWVLAFPVSATGTSGAGRALLAVAALSATGHLIARGGAVRASAGLAVILALLVLPPVARLTGIALHDVDRPWLRLLSPAELPAAALGERRAPLPPPPHTRPEAGAPGANPRDVKVTSETAGLFRRGIPAGTLADGPLAIGGEPPWFEALAAGPLFPVLHDRPALGAGIDWQPVAPDERLELSVRPGRTDRRRTATGWRVTAKEPPSALSVLEAFDVVAGAPPAFRVLATHRRGATRPVDPAVDPARYDALEPARFPDDLRRRLAILAALASTLTVFLSTSSKTVSRDAPPGVSSRAERRAALRLALLIICTLGLGAGARALRPRAVISERAVYRLLPNEPVAVRTDWIDVSAPAASSLPSFRAEATDGLTPILYARPERLEYPVVRSAGDEEVRGLRLGPLERRIFRALRAETLPGPLELAAGSIVNRTGVHFVEGLLIRARSVTRLPALEDGGTIPLPAALREPSPAPPRDVHLEMARELDARGRSGRELHALLAAELGSRPPPPGGWLVLVADRGAPPIARADVLAFENLPAVYIVALEEGRAR